MSKKIKGEDGKEYTVKEKKPFYKRIWFWILVVIVILIFIGVKNSSDDTNNSSETATSQTKSHNTTDKEKGTDSTSSSAKTVTIDYDDYKVADQKTVNPNFSDSSWAGTKVDVDKVEISKLDKPVKYESANDGTFEIQGVMRIHVSVKPQRDINFYPTQGKIVAGNEQQESTGQESWDGEIATGATKSGWVTFPLKSTEDLTSVRLQFDADYDTDNLDDDNSSHTYDMTLNL